MREELWINQTLSYEPGSPGREQLFDVLEQRYRGDIEQLNTVYGTSFATFPDLRQNGSLPYPRWISAVKAGEPLPEQAGSQEILADAEALLGEIVERVHNIAHAESASMTRNTWCWGPTSSTRPLHRGSGSESRPTSISSVHRMSVT